MDGIIKINGEEVVISENKSADIGLSSFSGYLGFVGEMSSQYGGAPGKTIGLVFDVPSFHLSRGGTHIATIKETHGQKPL